MKTAGLSKPQNLYKRNTGQFAPGIIPANTLKDGDIVTRFYRKEMKYRKFIRISKMNWMQLEQYNWKQDGKIIPEGYVLWHKDGDTLNCSVSNLEPIPRSELLARNNPRLRAVVFSPYETRKKRNLDYANRQRQVIRAEQKQIRIQKAIDRANAKAIQQNVKYQNKINALLEKAKLEVEKKEQRQQMRRDTRERAKDFIWSQKQKIEKSFDLGYKAKMILKSRAKQRNEQVEKTRCSKKNKVVPVLSQLQRIKIGNMTFFVKPGTDIERMKLRYDHAINPLEHLKKVM